MYRIVFFIELNRLIAGESGTFSSFFLSVFLCLSFLFLRLITRFLIITYSNFVFFQLISKSIVFLQNK